MHGNQWVLKIAVLKYYSVSKRGTTAKSNPKQATDPISLHTKFGDNSSNTFPLNERKPCVTPDIGRRTSDGEKSKNNISTPQGGGHNDRICLPVFSERTETTYCGGLREALDESWGGGGGGGEGFHALVPWNGVENDLGASATRFPPTWGKRWILHGME